MKLVLRPVAWLAVAANLTLSTEMISARPPRSERLAERMAERAYARQSIAEARAARASARVAEIAPLVPVPPPPRPATVRRMARAGVPLTAPATGSSLAGPPLPRASMAAAGTTRAPGPSAVVAPPSTPPPSTPPPATPPAAAATAARAARDGSPLIAPSADVAPDGTRSVLAAAEEPAAAAATRKPAGPPVTHPPIELLPTPQPQ
jgi:hypothetical protein